MFTAKSLQYKAGVCLITLHLLSCQSLENNPNSILLQRAETGQVAGLAPPAAPPVSEEELEINLALLLDTSGSMGGLIEQAKSQLWKIVNQLAIAQKGEAFANLKIALYEYGNTRISSKDEYVRQILPLTDDLDEISKELFALTISGGDEYCGEVIDRSMDELTWTEGSEGLQVIVIAGNEPFDQGNTSYDKACAKAKSAQVIVNTVYCGGKDEGERTHWKEGADLTNGFYANIDMNEATVYVDSPFDQQIQQLNGRLNATYLAYGSQRGYYSGNQAAQDFNAMSYGLANSTERIVSKTKGVYNNAKWDLVDASEEESFDLDKIEEEHLPEELKGKTTKEKEAIIEKNRLERETIKAEISALDVKRTAYIAEKKEEMGLSNGLDGALLVAIKEQAESKGFVFK